MPDKPAPQSAVALLRQDLVHHEARVGRLKRALAMLQA
jgi:hypothetical protein